MKKWTRAAAPAALLLMLGLAVPAQAGGGVRGCYIPWGFEDPWTLIEVAPNRANMFPIGGWTLYDGEPGSGVPSVSDYSHIHWLVPPHVTAQSVVDRLRVMGVPLVAPETIFLGKNPRAGEKVPPMPPADPKKDGPGKKIETE